MDPVLDLLTKVAQDVLGTFARVWPFLFISVVAAASVAVYVGTERASAIMRKRSLAAVVGAVLVAALTPFCSCGTTAILLGMMATASPWAPLVAFMVASPLTSPSELLLSVGLFGWPFAALFFGGTIVLGLVAGGVGAILDRMGWLADQARVRTEMSPEAETVPSFGPGAAAVTEPALRERALRERWKLDEFGKELLTTGRKLFVFFLAFTAIGYLAIEAIPTAWLTEYLGAGSVFAVPLAALLGIPAYINTEASLPLVAALMEGGMGPGPAMAFLVTGAGTSVGAISGLFVIARRRVVGLVVALLFTGALVMGWIGNALL